MPAPNNRTIRLTDKEQRIYKKRLVYPEESLLFPIINKTLCKDSIEALQLLPEASVDMIIADPPYNMAKTFNKRQFKELSLADYIEWLDSWIQFLPRIMKANAVIYLCGDWRSSTAIHHVLMKYFIIQNRITWEREKGRGAKSNWKNNSEDIWFASKSKNYTFNLDAVKHRRRVIAPYTDSSGKPKDWQQTKMGNFRDTCPSNIWTDLSVPFWSMPENTPHPTQKPEKLIAKLILANSNPGDLILDPFLGSGTTSVVAKKLERNYLGIDIDEHYCCIAEKRLTLADENTTIQGYSDGVFWERNVNPKNNKKKNSPLTHT